MKLAYFDPANGKVLQWINTEKMNYVLPDQSMLHECTDAEWAMRGDGDMMFKGGALAPYVAPEIPTAPIIYSCSPWQIRKALNSAGLREQIETAVKNSTDQNLKDGWEFATEFRSDDPFVIAMGSLLGKSSEEIAGLLAHASTL